MKTREKQKNGRATALAFSQNTPPSDLTLASPAAIEKHWNSTYTCRKPT